MISLDSQKTLNFLLDKYEVLDHRWNLKKASVFKPIFDEYRHHNFDTVNHPITFKKTGITYPHKLKILFAHFSTMKYELEALELPLYASKIFPNSQIDMCYFDSRGRVSPVNKCYICEVKDGNVTSPKENLLSSYDIIITRSNTLRKLRSQFNNVLQSSSCKINIQTNNFSPNFNIGEDFNFSHEEFYASGGRLFQNQAQNLMNTRDFQKQNIIAMVGTLIWWKGQLKWLQKIEPSLLKDYQIVMLGKIADRNYYDNIVKTVTDKKINFAFMDPVNPKFLADFLSLSKIHVMNHYTDPPEQPVLGPSRTFGESLVCNNITLQGQTYDSNLPGGQSSVVPEAWKDYTVEYDQQNKTSLNEGFVSATGLVDKLDFSLLESTETKMDSILSKCLALYESKNFT